MVKVLKERRANSTDTHLQVKSLSDYEIHDWDTNKVVAALRDECRIPKADAEKIAEKVHKELIHMEKKEIDIQTLKMMVNYHLLMAGFNGTKLSGQVSVGMSLHDLDALIHSKSNENSNIGQKSPEAIGLTVVENTFKKYALKKVFSDDVGRAHLEGLLHLHDLGQVTKNYCSGHSVRAIAMYGLGRHFKFEVVSKPARTAQVLVGHINTYLCTIAKYYAGALGLDFVNIAFAPYLEGKTYAEMKQVAQYMLFSIAQSAFSRGGQTLFVDFNVFAKIPGWLGKVKAVGPGGVVLSRTYSTYEKTSQEFLKAILEVSREGDALGQPFSFPKINLHIVEECFEKGEAQELLKMACEVSSHNGSPYFVFDHDSITIAACCRLRAKIEDPKILETPEFFRFCGFMNVSVNLPQCALRAKGDRKQFEKELVHAMDLAKKAHLQKKKFIESISQNPSDPMYEVCKKPYFDGKPYVDLDKATFIIGLVGMNECVKCLSGSELHENEDAFEMGKDIVAYMLAVLGKFKKETGLKFTLEESPAESAVRRMAKANIARFPDRTDLVRGSIEDDNIYLTNSIHFRPDADIPFVDRVFKQSEFHNMIESGAIIHMFCGENLPHPESLFRLIEKTFRQTNCAQLVVSPEFTVCQKCERVPGLHEVCPKCGNPDVERITRVVGYYSKVDNWNVSKKKEGKDRRNGRYDL